MLNRLRELWWSLRNDTRGGIFCLSIVLIMCLVYPKIFPFRLFQFFGIQRTISGIFAAWPILLWGSGITILFAIILFFRKSDQLCQTWDAEEIYKEGIIISIRAGIMEELVYRWAIFFWALLVFGVINSIFAICFGMEGLAWAFNKAIGPIVNLLTLGLAHELLYGYGWLVGFAIIYSIFIFQNGHRYLGFFGWLNSFYFGMFMFFLMFNYGILSAIITHFLYNFFIFTVEYAYALILRRIYYEGW